MEETDGLRAARAVRRAMLGDAHVDRMTADLREKFPDHVLTGRYAAGFSNAFMTKDVRLYLRAVEEQDRSSEIGAVTGSVWERFAAAESGADFTRIFPFIEGS